VNDLLRSLKPAIFVGSSRKDLQAFPAAVRGEIGQALFEAQLGDHPRHAKPLKGFSGVLEIRDNFDGDAYRAVYTVRFEGRPARPARLSKEIDERDCHSAATH
jgi:phage-related protein